MLLTIITARGGSKSIPLKNILPINKKPVLAYPITASLMSKRSTETWVDTDSLKISKIAKTFKAKVSLRPDYLGGDDVNHGDCIKDAYLRISRELKTKFKYILVLLGNTVMINPDIIDKAYDELNSNKEASGILTAWKAGDDHPVRALSLNSSGFLNSSNVEYSTNRQSYKDVYFYDQGIWMFKSDNLFNKEPKGPGPWWWMGEKCLIIEREWITGRDINGRFDVPFHEFWAKNYVDMF